MQNFNLAIVGGGNMASAMVRGLIVKGFVASNILVVEKELLKAEELKKKYSIKIRNKIDNSINEYDLVLLATKPQDLNLVCKNLSEVLDFQNPPGFISIAAGVLIQDINIGLTDNQEQNLSIVRVMPNTPAAIGKGISAGFANQYCKQIIRDFTQIIFQAVGEFLWIDNEDDLNAITAISGSGPAYFYYFCECLAHAGIELGLTKEIAYKLAINTMIGTSKLIELSDESITDLRQKVTSKGGTTEKAIDSLKKSLPEIVKKATLTAKNQSEFLSKKEMNKI